MREISSSPNTLSASQKAKIVIVLSAVVFLALVGVSVATALPDDEERESSASQPATSTTVQSTTTIASSTTTTSTTTSTTTTVAPRSVQPPTTAARQAPTAPTVAPIDPAVMYRQTCIASRDNWIRQSIASAGFLNPRVSTPVEVSSNPLTWEVTFTVTLLDPPVVNVVRLACNPNGSVSQV